MKYYKFELNMLWANIISVLLLIVGFIVLVKASDIFVDAVSSIATNINIMLNMVQH